MARHQVYLVGWLVAATVLLSLAGLTAEPFPPQSLAMSQLAG